MTKFVYNFANGEADGDAAMTALLGGKGANLAEMCSLGLPVPPGFTVSAGVGAYFLASGNTYPAGLDAQIDEAIGRLEAATRRRFGSAERPLLVSVRSGSRASMPGMMDTVLNLGLNDDTVAALARETGDERFALDTYRRFIQMYASIVLDVGHGYFEEILEAEKAAKRHAYETDFTAEDWRSVIAAYKQMVETENGVAFPQDPKEQLWCAIGAVFSSWMSRRAVSYRQIHDLPADWGTAVNIQAMVFGNLGNDSATGVAFTRNPSTGEKKLYGEFLVNAQGEDVVAGFRTPHNLTEEAREAAGSNKPALEKLMPQAFADLQRVAGRLERHFLDIQDIEFTIEKNKLWMLQTRSGKRTINAALRIAVEMTEEGLISKQQAISRIEPATLDHLLHPTLDPSDEQPVIATGLPASPGAASGQVAFSPEEAEFMKSEGRDVILVRSETSPEDIRGMHAAKGILTARGGMTSHAAVVARGMGKPCIVGAGTLRIDYEKGELSILGRTLSKGDRITIDGASGKVFSGSVHMVQPEFSDHFKTIMNWADGIRRLKIRANADTPADARAARSFGAEGIGLCRTERMFFDAERINTMREMILADSERERRQVLSKLLAMQRSDFVEMFEIMAGLPVAIRLLDPPLHEFLPSQRHDIEQVAASMGADADRLQRRVDALHEVNPMLGYRGCRLAIAYPEIVEMQARAIFEAVSEAAQTTGEKVVLEIMIPVVGMAEEFAFVKARIDAVAGQVMADSGDNLDYSVGTMIELPRAALIAGQLAETAEFFSFGTNDLTQTTFGISRDDASGFMGCYEARNILKTDPFVTIDEGGVGELMKIAVERGRATRAGMTIGICGEHGGDPDSICFCHAMGLDFVSCSPFRVPIARLAAAQAADKSR